MTESFDTQCADCERSWPERFVFRTVITGQYYALPLCHDCAVQRGLIRVPYRNDQRNVAAPGEAAEAR